MILSKDDFNKLTEDMEDKPVKIGLFSNYAINRSKFTNNGIDFSVNIDGTMFDNQNRTKVIDGYQIEFGEIEHFIFDYHLNFTIRKL